MSKGSYLAPRTIRIALGASAAIVVVAIAIQLPETARYVKSETMQSRPTFVPSMPVS